MFHCLYKKTTLGKKGFNLCKIWGFQGSDYEDCHLLGHDVVKSSRCVLTLIIKPTRYTEFSNLFC